LSGASRGGSGSIAADDVRYANPIYFTVGRAIKSAAGAAFTASAARSRTPLMSTRILALVGSLRAGSYNRQLAEAAVKHAPDGTDVQIFEGLAAVPFYNEDLDRPGEVPGPAQALRDAVQRTDALLLVTPEYNGTIPAALKNAIDWTSRPFHGGAIFAKLVAVVGASSGRYGGLWAREDTRQTARIAGARVLDDIALSVPGAAERFATTHPADDPEIATAMPQILARLAAAARATYDAAPQKP
jgi:NAD(P)H-dependent FMN reductase